MKIGIIGAMDDEIKLLKEQLVDPQNYDLANQKFSVGKLANHDVVLLKCGIGKVNAAVGTTLLNQLFHPDYIINTGCAGALGSSLEIGDITISSEVRYHDFDLTIFGYEFGQVAEMPACFIPDNHLVAIAEHCAKETANLTSIKKTLVLSGDSFISTSEQVTHLKNKFTESCVVEMEACAIAQVCYLFAVPFIIIRSISDHVEQSENKILYDNFMPLASKKSAEFVMCMLRKL